MSALLIPTPWLRPGAGSSSTGAAGPRRGDQEGEGALQQDGCRACSEQTQEAL